MTAVKYDKLKWRQLSPGLFPCLVLLPALGLFLPLFDDILAVQGIGVLAGHAAHLSRRIEHDVTRHST